MNKRKITILIVLIGLALLGLISIQGIWLKNAFQLKKDQFKQYVNNAITNATNQIQNSNNSVDSDYNKNYGSEILNSENKNYSQSSEIHENYPSQENINIRSKIQIIAESGLLFDSISYHQEFYAEYNSSEPKVKKPKQTEPTMVLPNGNPENNNVYNTPRLHITSKISPDALRLLISDHLMKNSVTLPFEYAVLDERGNFVMNSDSFKRDTKYHTYAGLIDYNRNNQPNFLVLYFPGEKGYLRHSLGLMSTSAIILTLVILLAFGYTLFFIYNQKKVSEIRTDFVNNMTHELKTPISTISLASQMLHDPTIPTASKNVEHLSKVILEESKRLSFQVERVLQTAIFEKGKIHLKIRQLDVHELINNVVRNFIIQVKNRNGTIIKNLDAQYSMVNVDEVHFANVLLNLLDNAIKYCQVQPNISVTTFNRKGFVVIQVQDNGIGIKKEDQKRVFEKFYRVPTGNVHNVKGFGLGLSYVKKIVDEHGGKIVVESEPNVGTRFDISIPFIIEN